MPIRYLAESNLHIAVERKLSTLKEPIMNRSAKGHKSKLPEWQSARMKSLIEDRWSEIWAIVVERERSTQELHQYNGNFQQDSN